VNPAVPSRGAVGGAANTAGGEYRRSVAAYTVACGLAGAPLDGLEIAPTEARVASVELETDEPVDDIRVRFSSGWTADIQAKRSLQNRAALDSAVTQWVQAGIGGVDPGRHRLVLVTGHLSRSARELRDTLDRRRLPHSGTPTRRQRDALDRLDALLAPLTALQRSQVLDAAVIWELRVEEASESGAREAIQYLRLAGFGSDLVARQAWVHLRSTADMLARRRGGYDLTHWLNDLRGAGLVIEPSAADRTDSETGAVPAGRLERRGAACERYLDRLVREANQLDLSPLGARLPPLQLDDIDAGVQVASSSPDIQDSRGDRDTRDLLWGLMRRHRVVLTGPPGGGKSTAVRKVAGQLAGRMRAEVAGGQVGDTAYPFPVPASLRDINARDKQGSFRDRMIDVAVRDEAAADRGEVRAEIEDRLDRGFPVALLLDSLDETYGDRATVVGELRAFLASLPDTAVVLLATRDVAYGEAATLGWADLRVLPPRDVTGMLTAILQQAAKARRVPGQQQDQWLDERLTWIQRALGHDAGLAETPLVPTLLAVLSIDRDAQQLPSSRALVLRDVVQQLMARHEIRRRGGRSLGRIGGDEVHSAALMAYAVEATAVLDANGVVPLVAVTDAVASVLEVQWALPPASAAVAASKTAEFLDETGVFVIAPAEQTVTARVSLFAEIGDALNVSGNPASSQVSQWLERRVEGGQFEPIVLAAALDERVSNACQAMLRTRPRDLQFVRLMVQAYREGASVAEPALTHLRNVLIDSLRAGTEDAWSDWARIETLGVPDELVDDVIEAAGVHSPEHQLYVRGSIELSREDENPGTISDELLLELLRLENLPRSANERDNTPTLTALMISSVLSQTQLDAAEILLRRRTPGAIDAIATRARYTSIASSDGLVDALLKFGHEQAAEQVRDSFNGTSEDSDRAPWLQSFDALNRYPRFLEFTAEGPRAHLDTRQRIQLDELADFVETLRLNEPGAQSLYRRDDQFLRDLIALTCNLFGFDRAVIASQAQIVLDRLAADDSFEIFYSLFDNAQARTRSDWSAVLDPAAAVDLVLELFMLTPTQGRFAALCLWESEVAAPLVAPRLRDVIDQLQEHPRHQYWAAVAYATLPTTPGPADWRHDPNPVLRRIAAQTVPVLVNRELGGQFAEFILDPDGYVRETAIQRLEGIDFPGWDDVLSRAATEPRPGWLCQNCAARNSPGATVCVTEKCHASGPRPDIRAAEILRGRPSAAR
jgi:hypothetical protein